MDKSCIQNSHPTAVTLHFNQEISFLRIPQIPTAPNRRIPTAPTIISFRNPSGCIQRASICMLPNATLTYVLRKFHGSQLAIRAHG